MCNCLNCVHNCNDHSLLDFKSAVQCMKYFIYHVTYFLYCWTLLNNKSVSGPREVSVISFDSLKPEAKTEPLQHFVSYIDENWIRITVWPPKCLSVFMQLIRTNHDIGGWHHSLNRRATGRCSLHFFMFVALLHWEARLVLLQIRLVSERKLKRMQRSTHREVQRRLFELWEAFSKKEKSVKQLFNDSVINN